MKSLKFYLTSSVSAMAIIAGTAGCKTMPEYELCETEPGQEPCADPVPVIVE